MKRIFFFISVFTLLLCTHAIASEKISPALDIIASESTMIKSSAPINGEILFDIDDFDLPIGTNVKSIKITSLPDSESGKLMLDNLYIVENQVISRENFSLLKLVNIGDSKASFKFSPYGASYEIECELISLSSVNTAPIGKTDALISASTMKNVAYSGTLLGYDSEGDDLTFEIVSYPKKGLVTLTSVESGDYIYTPYENARGKDKLSYRIRDSFGNYSKECLVEIKIDRKGTSYVFSDVSKTDAMAVTVACKSGIMEATKDLDGTYLFNPNEEITKEEFIYLLMRTLGASSVPKLEKTRFADDKDISSEYKGYLESAFSLGIIEGERKADGIYVYPKKPITLSEAAIIINRIVQNKSSTCMTVFLDSDQIPSEARAAIESLTESGYFKKTDGKISPSSPLTRAQTAQIIMTLLKARGK